MKFKISEIQIYYWNLMEKNDNKIHYDELNIKW